MANRCVVCGNLATRSMMGVPECACDGCDYEATGKLVKAGDTPNFPHTCKLKKS